MSKRNKILYWVFTIWMSLGMVSSAVVQLIQHPDEVKMFEKLGYPVYFMLIIGVWKILGVIVALAPKFPLLKEWAYAGFVFTMSGGFISHLAVHDGMAETLPPLFLLVLTVISYLLRPADRKIAA